MRAMITVERMRKEARDRVIEKFREEYKRFVSPGSPEFDVWLVGALEDLYNRGVTDGMLETADNFSLSINNCLEWRGEDDFLLGWVGKTGVY